MLSCQRISTALLGNLVIGTSWLVYSLIQLPDFTSLRLLWLVILLPAGVLSLYSVRFIFCASALIFTRAENIQYLWFQIYKLGMRPDSIYFPWVRFIILTVLPVAVVASVPATALIGRPNFWLFAWVVLWSGSLLFISHLFWNWCLKHYSSASS